MGPKFVAEICGRPQNFCSFRRKFGCKILWPATKKIAKFNKKSKIDVVACRDVELFTPTHCIYDVSYLQKTT
jgi:hypothetical protein